MRRLWRDRRGIAAVEAGIVLSALLVPLLAALVGIGQALLLQYRVDRATHMGLLYAWGQAAAATVDGAKSAAQAGYGTSTTSMTPTATLSCFCMDQTGTRTGSTTTAVSCSGSCTTSGQVLGRWMTVTSSASFVPVLLGPWGGVSWTMQNSSTVRIQ